MLRRFIDTTAPSTAAAVSNIVLRRGRGGGVVGFIPVVVAATATTTMRTFAIAPHPIRLPPNATIGYITDLEGCGDYFDRYVERSQVLTTHPIDKDQLLLKNPETNHFVFGGDLFDKGWHDLRLARKLLDLKKRYPYNVHLLIGNRDINKAKLTAELYGATLKESLVQAATGAGGGAPGSENPLQRPEEAMMAEAFERGTWKGSRGKGFGERVIPPEDVEMPFFVPYIGPGGKRLPSYVEYLKAQYNATKITSSTTDANATAVEEEDDGLWRILDCDVARLKWHMATTMGCQHTFEFRRREIAECRGLIPPFCSINAATGKPWNAKEEFAKPPQDDGSTIFIPPALVSDEEVVQSYISSLQGPGGVLFQYLQHAQLAVILGDTLFVHGAIGEHSLGFIPSLQTEERKYFNGSIATTESFKLKVPKAMIPQDTKILSSYNLLPASASSSDSYTITMPPYFSEQRFMTKLAMKKYRAENPSVIQVDENDEPVKGIEEIPRHMPLPHEVAYPDDAPGYYMLNPHPESHAASLIPKETPKEPTVYDWVNALNQFHISGWHSWSTAPSFVTPAPTSPTRRVPRRRGGSAWFMYGHSTALGPRTAMVTNFINSDTGDLQYMDLNTVMLLNTAGIRRVIVGHQPGGDTPTVMQQPGMSVLMGDNSYCDVSALDGRGLSVTEILLTSQGNGGQLSTESDSSAATTPFEAEELKVEIHGVRADGTDYTFDPDHPLCGQKLTDGRWTKMVLPGETLATTKVLVQKIAKSFFKVEYEWLSGEEVTPLLETAPDQQLGGIRAPLFPEQDATHKKSVERVEKYKARTKLTPVAGGAPSA